MLIVDTTIPFGTGAVMFQDLLSFCFSTVLSFSVFRRNATHCISPYAIVVCVCVCVCVCLYVCVCVCRVCGRQKNGLR